MRYRTLGGIHFALVHKTAGDRHSVLESVAKRPERQSVWRGGLSNHSGFAAVVEGQSLVGCDPFKAIDASTGGSEQCLSHFTPHLASVVGMSGHGASFALTKGPVRMVVQAFSGVRVTGVPQHPSRLPE